MYRMQNLYYVDEFSTLVLVDKMAREVTFLCHRGVALLALFFMCTLDGFSWNLIITYNVA